MADTTNAVNTAAKASGSKEGNVGGGFGPYKAGSKYPKGDPAKGRDPDKDIPMFIKGPQIAMRDRRAYLVDQAQKNEAANDEVNAHEVENNQRIAEIMFDALDPDKLRDETTEQAIDEMDRHTPENVEKQREFRQMLLRGRDSVPAPHASTAAHAPHSEKSAEKSK